MTSWGEVSANPEVSLLRQSLYSELAHWSDYTYFCSVFPFNSDTTVKPVQFYSGKSELFCSKNVNDNN